MMPHNVIMPRPLLQLHAHSLTLLHTWAIWQRSTSAQSSSSSSASSSHLMNGSISRANTLRPCTA